MTDSDALQDSSKLQTDATQGAFDQFTADVTLLLTCDEIGQAVGEYAMRKLNPGVTGVMAHAMTRITTVNGRITQAIVKVKRGPAP